MKTFYAEPSSGTREMRAARVSEASAQPALHIRTRARIAIYDAPAAAPRIEEIGEAPAAEYIETLAARVYELSRAAGGSVPYTVVREVAENFIHASFAEPVVSILDNGSTIRFADQGPGFSDKDQAVRPGFTTARGEMKRYIRGVGSGLPIVRDYLSHSGGVLRIEDNLGSGSVVTVCTRGSSELGSAGDGWSPAEESSLRPGRDDAVERFADFAGPARAISEGPREAAGPFDGFSGSQGSFDADAPVAKPRLSTRQKQVLAIVLESGEAGPSLVAKELGVGISTAYRDLASLEDAGFIAAAGGKRTVTREGLSYLDALLTS